MDWLDAWIKFVNALEYIHFLTRYYGDFSQQQGAADDLRARALAGAGGW